MGRILHDARVRLAALVTTAMLATSCGSSLFVCSSSDQCAGAGANGVCEDEGWCSFPDVACPSGRRYGDLAGDGLAGACVPELDGTTGPQGTSEGTTAQATSSSTSASDPTIATLEGGIETTSLESSGQDTDDMPVCGDNVINGEESCDLGADNGNGGACRDDCQLNVCGDGYVGPGEACDGTPDCTKMCKAASCGNGMIEGTEECDAEMGVPLACADIGYVSGSYTCVECMADVSSCEGCGADGCDYGTCDTDRECDDGEMCVNLDSSFCTATCESDADCVGLLPQVCVEVKGPPLCFAVCEDGDCPIGLDCYAQIMPPVCL